METVYRTKARQLPGTHWHQIMEKTFGQYKEITKKSKRRPYVRSAYFAKQKIFLGLFWQHKYTITIKIVKCPLWTKKRPKLRILANVMRRSARGAPKFDLFFIHTTITI